MGHPGLADTLGLAAEQGSPSRPAALGHDRRPWADLDAYDTWLEAFERIALKSAGRGDKLV